MIEIATVFGKICARNSGFFLWKAKIICFTNVESIVLLRARLNISLRFLDVTFCNRMTDRSIILTSLSNQLPALIVLPFRVPPPPETQFTNDN